MTIDPDLDLLTTAEVSRILHTPRDTLAHWRHKGTGPKWFKVGPRVFYERAAVKAFISEAKASRGTSNGRGR